MSIPTEYEVSSLKRNVEDLSKKVKEIIDRENARDRMSMFKRVMAWFDALSIGSLTTSGAFYLSYDQWKPLVWCSVVVGGIKVVQHVGIMMESN